MKVDIYAKGFEMSAALNEHVMRRMIFAAGWAHAWVREIAVRLSDENGPRGGRDKRCVIIVKLVGGSGDLVIEDVQTDPYIAVDCAADRLGQTLSRRLARLRARRVPTPGLAVH